MILNSANRLPRLNWSYGLHCVANRRAKILSMTEDINGENLGRIESLEDMVEK